MNKVQICFIVSLISTSGSLFFSEIMLFVPCSLCWYQRVFMYPLVIIFAIGLIANDDNCKKYALPLIYFGLFLALYHNLIMWGIIKESLSPCRFGIPCSIEYIKWFGFITIPLLSLIAFSIMLIALIKKER